MQKQKNKKTFLLSCLIKKIKRRTMSTFQNKLLKSISKNFHYVLIKDFDIFITKTTNKPWVHVAIKSPTCFRVNLHSRVA